MPRFILAALLIAAAVASSAEAKQPRSTAAKHAFQRENPCPATGERRGRCPGYVIDHIDPLCNGGADHKSNMQWQTIADAKEKDKEERRLCRTRRLGRDAE